MKRVVKNGGESVLGVGFVWSSWDLKVSHEHGLGGLAGIIGQDHRTELLSTVQKSAELRKCVIFALLLVTEYVYSCQSVSQNCFSGAEMLQGLGFAGNSDGQ